jgi:hypothetical protein
MRSTTNGEFGFTISTPPGRDYIEIASITLGYPVIKESDAAVTGNPIDLSGLATPPPPLLPLPPFFTPRLLYPLSCAQAWRCGVCGGGGLANASVSVCREADVKEEIQKCRRANRSGRGPVMRTRDGQAPTRR